MEYPYYRLLRKRKFVSSLLRSFLLFSRIIQETLLFVFRRGNIHFYKQKKSDKESDWDPNEDECSFISLCFVFLFSKLINVSILAMRATHLVKNVMFSQKIQQKSNRSLGCATGVLTPLFIIIIYLFNNKSNNNEQPI